MDVSIIIVNYNTQKLLRECISSIIDKTNNLNYEIIVVDNASSDDSISMIRSYFPQVRLIESEENLGFGRANNKGAEVANGKYLFLLNTDTLLINNAIKIFFDLMEEESSQNIGACGGNLFKIDQSPNFSYSLYFPSLFSIFCYRGHIPFLMNNENFNKSGKIKDVAIIIGADLFIRKKIFNEIKGFDPSIFMYIEDGELLYRIKKMKYRIVSNPEAKIIHLQGASSSNIKKLKMEISSYVVYFKKHHNLRTVYIYLLMELFFTSLKFFISILSFKKEKSLDYFSVIKNILHKNLKYEK